MQVPGFLRLKNNIKGTFGIILDLWLNEHVQPERLQSDEEPRQSLALVLAWPTDLSLSVQKSSSREHWINEDWSDGCSKLQGVRHHQFTKELEPKIPVPVPLWTISFSYLGFWPNASDFWIKTTCYFKVKNTFMHSSMKAKKKWYCLGTCYKG